MPLATEPGVIEILTIAASESVLTAVHQMCEREAERLLVVDAFNTPLGTVSPLACLRAVVLGKQLATRTRVDEVMEEIGLEPLPAPRPLSEVALGENRFPTDMGSGL